MVSDIGSALLAVRDAVILHSILDAQLAPGNCSSVVLSPGSPHTFSASAPSPPVPRAPLACPESVSLESALQKLGPLGTASS